MTRMSDEAFLEFLSRVRRRNAKVTQRQVEESIRQVRKAAQRRRPVRSDLPSSS